MANVWILDQLSPQASCTCYEKP